MKTYKEMADSVFERSNEILAQRAKRKKAVIKVVSAAACFAVIALAGVGINGRLNRRELPVAPVTDVTVTAAPEITTVGAAEPTEYEKVTSAEKTTAYNKLTEAEKTSAPPAKPNVPNAVYKSIPLSYSELKAKFGYPISECTHKDFVRYEAGVISPGGDINAGSAKYCEAKYIFKNGQVSVTDEIRYSGRRYPFADSPGIKIETYKGYEFRTDSHTGLTYYKINDKLVMSARFDDKDLHDVYDIMIELMIR